MLIIVPSSCSATRAHVRLLLSTCPSRCHPLAAMSSVSARRKTGYERLLYDCMLVDATIFQRSNMVESAWQIVGPILDVWGALTARNFPNYPAWILRPKKPTNCSGETVANGISNDTRRRYRRNNTRGPRENLGHTPMRFSADGFPV